ncbi:hypothetical protein DSO57_1025693 [Entomophthora muscae]|uniref:Uncharacterized protein n=1 Tax=Entomophthora muscae TaxID=34485 RepID=A0ACC2SR90_9FUNG|nr:hypothetical protein DSO57_1025693 [Entomophthora muscae]
MSVKTYYELARLITLLAVGFLLAWWHDVLPMDRPENWQAWTKDFRDLKASGVDVYKFDRELGEGDFSADAAYLHLLRMGLKIHSYNTDEIELVEKYLFSYARAIQSYGEARGVKVQVDFDRRSSILAYEKVNKLSKRSLLAPVYFEASNLIIRIVGQQSDALLVSAHHDSQGSSHGASDDGISVAIALELLRKASQKTPEHSLIVLLDSAEEKGLMGSRSFINHPWFKTIRAVINLEASGVGGRAILFQANNDVALEAFRFSPHPFGTSIGNDAFRQGLINSRTDFEVYRAANLSGIDMAICSNRAFYHTRKDDVEHVYFSSLKRFGETVLSASLHLLKKTSLESSSFSGGVFFSILGYKMIVFSQPQMIYIVQLTTILLSLCLLTCPKIPIRGLLAIVSGVIKHAAVLAVSIWLVANLHLHNFASVIYLSSTLLGLSCICIELVVWAKLEGVAIYRLEKPLLSSLILLWLVTQLLNLFLLRNSFSSLYPTLFLSLSHAFIFYFDYFRLDFGFRVAVRLEICLMSSILLHDSVTMLILSLSQSIPTGSSNFGTHLLISFMSILPVLSFVPTLPTLLHPHPWRVIGISLVAWFSCLIAIHSQFPLSSSAPMAVHFEQHTCITPQLGCMSMLPEKAPFIYRNLSFVRAIAPSYLDMALSEIPSAAAHPLSKVVPYYHMKQKLYVADPPSLPPSSISLTLISSVNDTVVIEFAGQGSRICGLRFLNVKLKQLSCSTLASPSEVIMIPNSTAPQSQFMLMRRSPKAPFIIKATTFPNPPHTLRISTWCGYDDIDKYIPAIQEAQQNLPPWAVLSTTQATILTIHADFTVFLASKA